MLTDYHVHLRPDEDGTGAERYFTAANADRYREAASERGIAELGVAEHIHRFVQSLQIWEHPWYRHWAKDDVDEYCDFVHGAGLRLGVEADYLPGHEDRVGSFLDGRPWDYVVGSVHFLRDEALDLHGEPDWEAWDVWRSATRTRSGRATSRPSARPLARESSTSSPIPTWSRSGGRACRGRKGTRAASTSARWTGSPARPGHRGLDRGPAQTCPGDLSRRGVPRDVPRCRPAGRPVE